MENPGRVTGASVEAMLDYARRTIPVPRLKRADAFEVRERVDFAGKIIVALERRVDQGVDASPHEAWTKRASGIRGRGAAVPRLSPRVRGPIRVGGASRGAYAGQCRGCRRSRRRGSTLPAHTRASEGHALDATGAGEDVRSHRRADSVAGSRYRIKDWCFRQCRAGPHMRQDAHPDASLPSMTKPPVLPTMLAVDIRALAG